LSRKSIREAVELYTKFHWGRLPRELREVRLELPEDGTFVHLGKLLGVIYLADKGDGAKPYVHFFGGEPEPLRLACNGGEPAIEKLRRFSLSRFPDLLTDTRGRNLYIANFKGRVKEEGIVG